MATTPSMMSPLDALREHFAMSAFRPPQDAVIEAVLSRRDVMVIMPTGGGKSLCYQLPALLMPGVTLVVSPLIALMKDQVDALRARGLAAGLINSSQTAAEQSETLRAMAAAELKLVYVAPERFRSRAFLHSLQQIELSLFAIDEAHCLSQWGHDFRPDYLRLAKALEQLGRPPVAAFTATATPEVRDDIQSHLKMREPKVFVSGFARPNLHFKVKHTANEDEKLRLLDALVRSQKKGIIYCATRKKVEAVASRLGAGGRLLVAYHGGMDEATREAAQNKFMQGQCDLVVATNAFGMGIDRADLRFVAHYEMPGSIEAYYQEAGRAGRDGLPSECLLLFNFADKRTQDFFVEGSNPGVEVIRAVYDLLCEEAGDSNEVLLAIDDLGERLPFRVNPMAVSTALSILSRHGIIERFDVPGRRIRGTRLRQPNLASGELPLDADALARKQARDEAKVRAVVQYAYDERTCRQQWILRYFGETNGHTCGQCDVCGSDRHRELREGDADETALALKALSGIARMSRRLSRLEWQPRFGKTRVIQCLLGSQAEPVRQAGLDKLSTHGILKGVGRDYVQSLLREMERAGMVYVTEGDYPLLGLSELGARVMLGETPCCLDWPPRHPQGVASGRTHAPAAASEADYGQDAAPDAGLLEKLRRKRSQLAAARGGVPPYVIFTNQVLEHLALRRPTSAEEAMQIPGIGETKARKILPAFLRIIGDHMGCHSGGGTSRQSDMVKEPSPKSSGKVSS